MALTLSQAAGRFKLGLGIAADAVLDVRQALWARSREADTDRMLPLTHADGIAPGLVQAARWRVARQEGDAIAQSGHWQSRGDGIDAAEEGTERGDCVALDLRADC
jgi:hypothetical protein